MNALDLSIPIRYEEAVGLQQMEERVDRWLATDETVAVVQRPQEYEVVLIRDPSWTTAQKIASRIRAALCCPCLCPIKSLFRLHHLFHLRVKELDEKRQMYMEDIDSKTYQTIFGMNELICEEREYMRTLEHNFRCAMEVNRKTIALLPTMNKQLETGIIILRKEGEAPPKEPHIEASLTALKTTPTAPAKTLVSLEGEERRVNLVILRGIPSFQSVGGGLPIKLDYPVEAIDGFFDIYLGCRESSDFSEDQLWAIHAFALSIFRGAIAEPLRWRLGVPLGNVAH